MNLTLDKLQAMSEEKLNDASAVQVMGWKITRCYLGNSVRDAWRIPYKPHRDKFEWEPTTDPRHAAELEDEIEKRGLWDYYFAAVRIVLKVSTLSRYTPELVKKMMKLNSKEATISALLAVQESERKE